MEQIEETISMLDLMIRPAFCVKNGIIVQVNEKSSVFVSIVKSCCLILISEYYFTICFIKCICYHK